MKTVAVVTATTGRKELQQTIDSVARQTYPCKHYIFFDGVTPSPDLSYSFDTRIVELPVKTGITTRSRGIMLWALVALR